MLKRFAVATLLAVTLAGIAYGANATRFKDIVVSTSASLTNTTLAGGGSMAGTFSGTPTFSGDMTFTSTGLVFGSTSNANRRFTILSGTGGSNTSTIRMGTSTREWEMVINGSPYAWNLNYIGTDAALASILTATKGGLVGVGIATALEKLHVSSGGASTAQMRLDRTTVGSGGSTVTEINMYNGGNSIAQIKTIESSATDAGSLIFSTRPTGGSVTERLRVMSTGDLYAAGNAALGQSAAPDTSAILELESTTKGFLPPRMTTTQRDAIGSPANGLLIYNSTTGLINAYLGAWTALTTGTVTDYSARATKTSAQAITATTQIIDFDTVEFDPESQITTGASWKFTADVTGKYAVDTMVATASTSWTAGDFVGQLIVRKNGSSYASLDYVSAERTGTRQYFLGGSTLVPLSATDYLDIVITAGSSWNVSTTANNNHVSIYRVDD